MWKNFEIYSIKKVVLVRKGRAFYAPLYQEVFFGDPGGGGGSWTVIITPDFLSIFLFLLDNYIPSDLLHEYIRTLLMLGAWESKYVYLARQMYQKWEYPCPEIMNSVYYIL